MFDPFTLAMIGAGIGALTNPKKPIQGAIIGGGLGYGGGLLAAPAGATATTAATTGTSAIVPGSIESAGMVTGASGNLVNPEYFVGAGTPFQTYTGGEGLLSNAFGDIKAAMPDITPQNMIGLASLLNQPDTSAYQSQAGVGGVSRGSGQGLAVEMPQARVFKRRKA